MTEHISSRPKGVRSVYYAMSALNASAVLDDSRRSAKPICSISIMVALEFEMPRKGGTLEGK